MSSNSAILTPKPEPVDNTEKALVPIQPLSTTQTPPPVLRHTYRSSQLVRVTNFTPQDASYFSNLTRRTRIIYESARLFAKNCPVKVRRPDLKAGSWMRDNSLFLNTEKRLVGNLPGINVGDVFLYRMEMVVLGLHGQVQAGIDYVAGGRSENGEPVATSVIVSGGYEDDVDEGEVVVYTGHGGQDNRNRQVEDQILECGNLGLERSLCYGVEVRVVRGVKYEGVGTGNVYVYDGLYKIEKAWFEVGKSGFGVYKFRLIRIQGQEKMGSSVMRFAESLKKSPMEVRKEGYLSLDLSKGKEGLPVYLFNDVDEDKEPLGDRFEYVVRSDLPDCLGGGGFSGVGCECEGECGVECVCYARNGGEFPYDGNGVLLKGKPLVFECGPRCRCKLSCRNRVAQKGVRHRFEVFRTNEGGWGVRSLDLIQAGTFICEYAGVFLTRELWQPFVMNGGNLIYPSRFAKRWREWGDLSRIFCDYEAPSYPSIPPLDFAMDVSKMRNVAYYIRHSSSPNLFVQLVLYDHNNLSFPRIMLFAMENIPPMRELTLDYGVAEHDDSTGKLAICC